MCLFVLTCLATASVQADYPHRWHGTVHLRLASEAGDEALDIRASLSDIPVVAVLTEALVYGGDLNRLTLLLARQGARMELDPLELRLPQAKVTIPRLSIEQQPGTGVRVSARVEVRGFDAMVDWVGDHLTGADPRHVRAIVAVLRLAAREEHDEQGARVHHFALLASSTGGLYINSKDVTPLFNLGRSTGRATIPGR